MIRMVYQKYRDFAYKQIPSWKEYVTQVCFTEASILIVATSQIGNLYLENNAHLHHLDNGI